MVRAASVAVAVGVVLVAAVAVVARDVVRSGDRGRRRALLIAVGASVVVLVVMVTPTIVEQVVTTPGNLTQLLDAHGLQKAVLVGHSLGGMVALQMWARHPERVAGLVLAASSPAFGHGSGDFQQAFVAQRLAPLEAGKSMRDVAEGLVPSMVAPGFDGPGLAQAKVCMGSITPAAYKAALGALVQFEQRAILPSITVPTLCIAAEHDRTAAPTVVQRMADKIPNAQYQYLSGVGHLLTFEQPDSFAQTLLSFLRSIHD